MITEIQNTEKVIKMPDGGTLILMNSPSKSACENFVKIVLEIRNKTN